MFVRAVVAFLALPGMVAYVVPFLLAPSTSGTVPWRWAGVALIAAGSILLLGCVRDFYVTGKGTLAPWSPPRRLVRSGPYRWSRNPMYLAVLVVVLGWAVFHRSSGLWIYLGTLAAAFHLRILRYEEPRLNAAFGEEWAEYRKDVPRWLPYGRSGRTT